MYFQMSLTDVSLLPWSSRSSMSEQLSLDDSKNRPAYKQSTIVQNSVWQPSREEMLGADHINLVPPVVESRRFHDLVKAGQTVSASLSPSSNSLAVFLTNTVCLLH